MLSSTSLLERWQNEQQNPYLLKTVLKCRGSEQRLSGGGLDLTRVKEQKPPVRSQR